MGGDIIGTGVDNVPSHHILPKNNIPVHSPVVPVYTHMLRICTPGTYKARTDKGHGTCHPADTEMQPVGRKRL